MNNRQKKGGGTQTPRMVQGTTLREENTGKRNIDSVSLLKMEHLQKLATWAGGEANIPPLGALFGRQLASNAEAEGVALKTFLCERCESILQPGFNCTIRIEKNVKKTRRRKNSHIPSQNNVLYKCHFCSHPNSMRGTQKVYVIDLLRSRPDANSNLQPFGKVICSTSEKKICSSNKVVGNFKGGLDERKILDQNVESLPSVTDSITELTCIIPGVDAEVEQISVEESPVTPLLKLLDSSKKKRKTRRTHGTDDGTGSATLNSGEGTGGSSRRKRKGGWSSLKKITESNEAGSSRTIRNFVIPLVLQVSK
ncbi:uncharacterized protein M6B38_375925 [Iris pallida]|uniref:Uncharacterized protein n=1 Tax=Iris pallida TaxID=29817 RepID=A0AAX6G9M8_IRIPA|nr:uncharacterized protein M6B38_375925 [Iris pallida]